jgi:processive 1,2-diacylglycerol beta-glucosyltransferase
MNILAFYQEGSACCYHRVFLPFSNLPLREGDQVILKDWSTRITDSDFEGVDLVVYNRIPPVQISQLFAWRRTFGFKIVVDIDDWWVLHEHHPLRTQWILDGTSEQIKTNLIYADLVLCTNEPLRKKVLPLNPNCEIVPNALPFGVGQFNSDRDSSDKVRVIYAAGSSHLPDVRSVARFFEKTANDGIVKRGGEVILAGVGQSQIWNQIKRIIRPTRTLPLAPLHSYMDLYKEADISLAPLAINEFNNCKSNLKVIEAGAKGIPLLATNTLPYSADRDCRGVILCNNTSDWFNNLKRLIKDKNYRQDLGEELHEYVLRYYDLEKVNQARFEILIGLYE